MNSCLGSRGVQQLNFMPTQSSLLPTALGRSMSISHHQPSHMSPQQLLRTHNICPAWGQRGFWNLFFPINSATQQGPPAPSTDLVSANISPPPEASSFCLKVPRWQQRGHSPGVRARAAYYPHPCIRYPCPHTLIHIYIYIYI